MSGLRAWLSGKKTYLLGAAVFVVSGLHGLHYLTDAQYETLLGLLGAGVVATVRAAIAKLGTKGP